MTLNDLSREHLSDTDIDAFDEYLIHESDRGAALMAGAHVEQALTFAIWSRIVDPGEQIRKTWFEGNNAPFATFAAKITLGRALGIYGPVMETALIAVKNVRNCFAHRAGPLDFAHPLIVESVKAIVPRELDEGMPTLKPAKIRFAGVCLSLGNLLEQHAKENVGKTMPLAFP